MNEQLIINYIENEYENEFLDFKIKPYNWSEIKSKSDFLSDVISLANSATDKDRYIILGVKIKDDGERIIKGIDKKLLMDSSEYQQIVVENIEPDISIELKIISNNDLDFGIIRIFNCNNRPYLLKKKYGNLEQGYIKIRKGSRNTNISRYILDEIYSSKTPKIESDFKISGLIDGKQSDEIMLIKYDFFPDLKTEKEYLVNLLNKINDYIIDDISNIEQKKGEVSNLSTLKLSGELFEPQTKTIDESIVDNIKSFAAAISIELSNDFFNLGDLAEKFSGIGHSGTLLGITTNYKLVGSDKSKEKYNLIIELNEKLNKAIAWVDFMNLTKDFGYIELVITEIGNVPDEEIEVNIELPKSNYINYDDFPEPSDMIIRELNEHYSEKMFKPYYLKDISDFRKKILSTGIHTPPTTFNPLLGGSSEILDGLYDYIDYDVSYNNDTAILNFTIKNLKEKETMVFPGKILIKGNIDELNYSIISKKSQSKISGVLKVSYN